MSDLHKHLEERHHNGAREYSPSAGRNIPPLVEVLSPLWPKNGHILEIASGTGQHAAAFCQSREDLTWQTSDPDEAARKSQNAWAIEAGGRIQPSLNLSMMRDNWWDGLGPFDAIFCANMIHIAPSATVPGLADGAAALLPTGACLYLYGPFQEGGETAPSNLNFDESLKRRNPDWGVRDLSDVKHIFATRGLSFSERIVMPKENRLLVFKRS